MPCYQCFDLIRVGCCFLRFFASMVDPIVSCKKKRLGYICFDVIGMGSGIWLQFGYVGSPIYRL